MVPAGVQEGAAMQQRGQELRWWVLGSAALMVVGAFGPWVKALGQSVGGTDGSNDGWLVVVAAGLGALLFGLARGSRGGGVWALLGGVAGVAVTLYDRTHLQNAINHAGALARVFVEVGWGLNLALAASVSLALAGVVYLMRRLTPAPLAAASAADANPYGLPRERLYRECPHCRESIRRDAESCPHCRQPSTPWRFHDGRWWYRENDEEPWEWLDEHTGEWVELGAPVPPAN